MVQNDALDYPMIHNNRMSLVLDDRQIYNVINKIRKYFPKKKNTIRIREKENIGGKLTGTNSVHRNLDR